MKKKIDFEPKEESVAKINLKSHSYLMKKNL